ncbi:hypothetical protein LLG46_01610 [bacterium]|nr:hypothetical protein [bacterium]
MRQLQSLDNVEYRLFIAPFAFTVIAAFASMPIISAAMMWDILSEMRATVIWGCAIILMPVIWTLYRCLKDAYYWKTDAYGITQHSFFRRFTALWDQVESVRINSGLLGSRSYQINTSVGTISIPDIYGPSRFTNLLASIRQHLAVDGRPDIPFLPESVLSFWYSIPDEVPTRMEWTSVKGVEWLPLAFLWSMLAVFCIVFSGELKTADAAIITMVTVLGVVVASATIYTLKNITVGKYCISEESIAVHHKSKSITIPWATIEHASWSGNPNGGSAILIRQNDPKRRILIPYDRKDDDSGRLILSAIRALQSVGIYLPIPRRLRVSNPQYVNVSQDGVKLSLHRMIKYGLPLMFVFIGILPLLPITPKQHNNDSIWIAAFALALVILFGVVVNYYRICADENKLHMRTIFSSKTISWDEVGTYEKIFCNTGEYGVYKIRLLDKQEKVRFKIESSSFFRSEWDTLVAYIDSKVGYLLADETKSWLARPYD